MAKKKRKSQKGWLVPKKQVNHWLTQASDQLLDENYQEALQTARRVLRYVPATSRERVEALEYLATAQTMLRQFEDAYQTLTVATELAPEVSRFWYNRALLGRYTSRLAQAVFDLEMAVELEPASPQRDKWADLLVETRELAEGERALRGPDFSLEQLREQQEQFGQGLHAMSRERWAEAETHFRRVIEMAECHAAPWGNLGVSLLMQKRYDDAEAALKRSLEIEPDYDLARRNLTALPALKESGETPMFVLRNPYAQANINLSPQIDGDA
jgi:Flp pilus assembly protein TadD